jgi:hypothetical protein
VSPVAEDVSKDFTFTRAPDAEFVWVHHAGTDGTAQVPVASLPFWAARDWEPCDPPDEVDPTRAHLVEALRAEAQQAEDAKDSAPDDAVKPQKSGRAGTSSKGSD